MLRGGARARPEAARPRGRAGVDRAARSWPRELGARSADHLVYVSADGVQRAGRGLDCVADAAARGRLLPAPGPLRARARADRGGRAGGAGHRRQPGRRALARRCPSRWRSGCFGMGLSLEEALARGHGQRGAARSTWQAEVGSLEVGQARRPGGPALARACWTSCAWASRPSAPWSRTGGWWSATDGGSRRPPDRRRRGRGPRQDLPGTAQGAGRWRRCAGSRSRCSRASSSACWARTGPARAPRSAASPRWCGRPAGASLVDGLDVVERPAEAKRRIAVVPQTRNLDRDLTRARGADLPRRLLRPAARPSARPARTGCSRRCSSRTRRAPSRSRSPAACSSGC